MMYFFTLFEKTEEKDLIKLQEKTLETVDSSKETLTVTKTLLKGLVEGFRDSNPRLFPLSDEQVLSIYTSEPSEEGIHKLLQLFPGLKTVNLNEKMLIST